jgi:hypothetical protein
MLVECGKLLEELRVFEFATVDGAQANREFGFMIRHETKQRPRRDRKNLADAAIPIADQHAAGNQRVRQREKHDAADTYSIGSHDEGRFTHFLYDSA